MKIIKRNLNLFWVNVKNLSVQSAFFIKAAGFTLAEILITLSIIGVIASMTIPSLVQDVQDAQFKTAWKKSFADLGGAFSQARLHNGGSFKGLCIDNNCIRDKIIPYLNYIKSCNNSSTNGANACVYNTQTELKMLSGNKYNSYWSSSGLILNSGSIVWIGGSDNTCNTTHCNSNVKTCGWYMVDVNGAKGPNTIGKDVFHGWILKDRTLPVGVQDENNTSDTCHNLASCNKTSSSASGWGCSALYLRQ